MAALQIRAIAVLLLWFAPCHEQKSIDSICAIKRATLHWRRVIGESTPQKTAVTRHIDVTKFTKTPSKKVNFFTLPVVESPSQ
jgi:hypothetical protein